VSSLEYDPISAREIQRAFLPPIDAERRGVHALAEYRPAFAVGGDFYDVVHHADGRVTAFVGDVAGKGVSAALLMALVSGEMRQLARSRRGPRRILGQVNTWLEPQLPPDRFVTAACVQFEPAAERWIFASAGHVPPLVFRRGGSGAGGPRGRGIGAPGELVRVSDTGGPPLGLGLGLGGGLGYEEQIVEARPGDIVVLLTDGITDVLPGGPQAPDLERLRPAPAPAREQLQDIRARVAAALDGAPGLRDDATLLALALDDLSLRLD
jgi:serine phosphatase RsbU (regulator of sigma subunit)